MASSEALRKPVSKLARVIPLTSALPVLLAHSASAATWELTPTLSVGGAYTDNVTLAPSGLERSDVVMQVVPGINLRYNGPKLKFQAAYRLEMLYSTDTSDLTTHNQWNGNTLGSVELLPQFLYLDTRTNVGQQNTSLLGPLATSNINRTGNRATVLTSTFSPFIRHDFGSAAQGELRFTYTTVSSDAETVTGSTTGSPASMSDSTAPRISARLSSGPAFRLTTWSAFYQKERIDYKNNTETHSEKFNANARRLLTHEISGIVNLGYEETISTSAATVQSKGPTWSLGLGWDPSPRTSVSATLGRRGVGGGRETSNNALLARYRTALMSFNASYSEDVTDTRSQLLGNGTANTADYLDSLFLSKIPDPIERQQAVQTYIQQNGLPPTLSVPLDFFSTQVALTKQWLGGVGYEGRRNTVLANFFTRTSTTDVFRTAAGTTPGVAVGAGDFNAGSTVKQTGGSVNWIWRITPFDSSNASLGYTRSEFPATSVETSQTYLRLSYSHQFSPKVTGFVNLRRLTSDSNQGTAGTYTENAITAALGFNF